MRTRTSAVPGRASRTGWSCSLRCSIPISSRAHRSKAERWCGRSSYIVPCGDRFPMRRLAFLALTLATGCSDALEKTSSAGQVIGVINVSDLSLVSPTDFSVRSEEHTSELQSLAYLVCRLLLEKKKKKQNVLAL